MPTAASRPPCRERAEHVHLHAPLRDRRRHPRVHGLDVGDRLIAIDLRDCSPDRGDERERIASVRTTRNMLVVPSEPCAYGTYTSGSAALSRPPYSTSSATPTMVKLSGA